MSHWEQLCDMWYWAFRSVRRQNHDEDIARILLARAFFALLVLLIALIGFIIAWLLQGGVT